MTQPKSEIMKVAIKFESKKGFVHYNEQTKEITVELPDEVVKKKVENYLSTRRVFRIPESNRLDDFRENYAYPFENVTYFKLAMSTLYNNTNVWVDWR